MWRWRLSPWNRAPPRSCLFAGEHIWPKILAHFLLNSSLLSFRRYLSWELKLNDYLLLKIIPNADLVPRIPLIGIGSHDIRSWMQRFFSFSANKLTKARKTRKSPATLCLKKFVPGKLWVQKVRAQNIFIDFLAELDFIRNPTKTQNWRRNKLQATLVWNYDPATDWLTGVKCRATSVAKNWKIFQWKAHVYSHPETDSSPF